MPQIILGIIIIVLLIKLLEVIWPFIVGAIVIYLMIKAFILLDAHFEMRLRKKEAEERERLKAEENLRAAERARLRDRARVEIQGVASRCLSQRAALRTLGFAETDSAFLFPAMPDEERLIEIGVKSPARLRAELAAASTRIDEIQSVLAACSSPLSALNEVEAETGRIASEWGYSFAIPRRAGEIARRFSKVAGPSDPSLPELTEALSRDLNEARLTRHNLTKVRDLHQATLGAWKKAARRIGGASPTLVAAMDDLHDGLRHPDLFELAGTGRWREFGRVVETIAQEIADLEKSASDAGGSTETAEPGTAAWALQVLGLPHNVDGKVIKLVYRGLANAWHPDHGGDMAKMISLNKAYEILRQAGMVG
jgi:hypothetical protein